MEWKKLYEEKLVSIKEAAAKINSGDTAWFGACSSAPIQLVEAIADRADELENVDLISGMSLYPFKMFKDPSLLGKINYHTIFFGAAEASFVKLGTIDVNSIHLSQLGNVLENYYKPNVVLADVTPPDEDGYMYFGPMGVSENGYAAEHFADKVIVQVNKCQLKVKGTYHRIHVSDVDYICEFDHPLPILPQPEVSDIDKKIAEIIIPEIADGSCIQIGLGGLANAIGYGLDSKKDLSVHTEMFTDSMVYLAKKGVINGKIYAGFGLGSQELYEFVGEGKVELAPINIVNTPSEIGKNDNFVSINSCVMVDLTGQVCSESIGFRQISGTGGQLDYVRGAGMSKGGKSFLCLPSTKKDKEGNLVSTIVSVLPDGGVITTPRSDVMYIVTEYGIADLYNKPYRERVKELIKIAHPDFREKLTAEAKAAKLIK